MWGCVRILDLSSVLSFALFSSFDGTVFVAQEASESSSLSDIGQDIAWLKPASGNKHGVVLLLAVANAATYTTAGARLLLPHTAHHLGLFGAAGPMDYLIWSPQFNMVCTGWWLFAPLCFGWFIVCFVWACASKLNCWCLHFLLIFAVLWRWMSDKPPEWSRYARVALSLCYPCLSLYCHETANSWFIIQ